MIKITDVKKTFDGITAVSNISMDISQGTVFGLLGINGAGKSTLLRMMAGILFPDEGAIAYDGKELLKNPEVKQDIFYLPDDFYFFPNATVTSMAEFYQSMYPDFCRERFEDMYQRLGFDDIRKIRTFSKGMKKQIAILLAICSGTSYILCDEIFDGLDPIVRRTIQELIRQETDRQKLTMVIASHNLRELESICNFIGIIHKGGILLSRDVSFMEHKVHKYQCVFETEAEAYLLEKLEVVSLNKKGFLMTILASGSEQEIEKIIMDRQPVKYEKLPLTLEEVFIYEGENIGYDISTVIS